MPAGYSFVPKGDVYITRKCRLMTKEIDQVVYKVYVSTHTPLLRHPSSIPYRIILINFRRTQQENGLPGSEYPLTSTMRF